jgi:hypothetical protein
VILSTAWVAYVALLTALFVFSVHAGASDDPKTQRLDNLIGGTTLALACMALFGVPVSAASLLLVGLGQVAPDSAVEFNVALWFILSPVLLAWVATALGRTLGGSIRLAQDSSCHGLPCRR